MDKVFIDTDVILDFLFDRKPFSAQSAEVFSLCEKQSISGYITPVIYSNLYYILRRTAPHKKVIEKLKQLASIIKVIPMNQEVVLNALNSNFKDFEDGLQHFAAVNYGQIDVILTRNLKDYHHSQIGVLTPESFLKLRD